MYGDVRNAIRLFIPPVRSIRGWSSSILVRIAEDFLEGGQVQERLSSWILDVFPTFDAQSVPRQHYRIINPGKKLQRRIEYARVQRLFRLNISRASKEILNGAAETNAAIPSVQVMADHWGPFVSQASDHVPSITPSQPKSEFSFIWHPVSCEEVAAANLPLNAAPGLDGITVRQWRAVPTTIRALLFNVVLAAGGFPAYMLASRTVFLPKKTDSSNPGDFRPISITSVVVRQFHKIIAQRLRESNVVDLRQRCFDDGCGENVAVLSSLLLEARSRLRELHVASLDIAKAFDSVSHYAISNILAKLGMPTGFRSYVDYLYANSSTTFEVCGSRSELFRVGRGVRQGDPLSPVLFCLVIDSVLGAMPSAVGFQLGECRLNSLAYADDILLFSSTRWGLQTSLCAVEDKAREQGLSFSPSKCSVLSIVPSGKQKKIKICTIPTFELKNGSYLPQIASTAEWRYLGVDFKPAGPKKVGSDIVSLLDRVTRAPLKPQQRLMILRCFLIPRLYHALVLGNVTLGKLRSLDLQTRAAVRRWLRLPKDIPVAFFHAATRDGGLGIPAMSTTIPGLIFLRLRELERSSSPQVRAVTNSAWVVRRVEWARRALTRDGTCLSSSFLRNKWWAQRLYCSVDGKELQECSRSTLSSGWVDHGSLCIPGRDYVQYVHLRINSLPTRIRTSRGFRRASDATACRAGCSVSETAAHVIQGCHRTHGGRVLRHNAVCRTLAAGLRKVGWHVSEEPVYLTSEGKRKPDLVCKREDEVHVIDAQVVSGSSSLDDAHTKKLSYYANNNSLLEGISTGCAVQAEDVKFSSFTVSWRGIWSSKSADWLVRMGLSKGLVKGITTRVLQGSHTNWSRWNRMTSMRGLVTESVWQGIG